MGIRLPREIGVILPIGIICITIWGIRLCLVLANDIKSQLDSVLLGA